MSRQTLRLKLEELKQLIDSENSSASPHGDMDSAIREKYEKLNYKIDLIDDILTDLSGIFLYNETAQTEVPAQGPGCELYAVIADGFVTLTCRDVLEDGDSCEFHSFTKRYPLAEGCDVELLKAHLPKIGVKIIVPPPGLVNIQLEDANPDGEAVDVVPPGDGQ